MSDILLIDSAVLGEQVVYCRKRKSLATAYKEFPGTVVYVPPELEELEGLDDQTLHAVHLTKKLFGTWDGSHFKRAWIIPRQT